MSLWRLLGVEHTATLRGETVEFASSARKGTWMLLSDAIQACKDAGIYEHARDADKIRIDGAPYRWSRWE